MGVYALAAIAAKKVLIVFNTCSPAIPGLQAILPYMGMSAVHHVYHGSHLGGVAWECQHIISCWGGKGGGRGLQTLSF